MVRREYDAKTHAISVRIGAQLDVSLPSTAVTNELLTAARRMGFASQDFAVLLMSWLVWRESRIEEIDQGMPICRLLSASRACCLSMRYGGVADCSPRLSHCHSCGHGLRYLAALSAVVVRLKPPSGV
jgi:hypothetical protein